MGKDYFGYAEQDLKDLQGVLLGMLREFDAICRAHDIPWFLLYGSALGAVRHKGFIPWDDDVDIGMMRSDYLRLKEVFREQGNEINSLTVTDATDGVFYHDTFIPRIYKKGTVFQRAWFHDFVEQHDEKMPVWLDLFLFDYVDSEQEAERIEKKSFALHRRYQYRKYDFRFSKSAGLATNLKTAVKKLYHLHAKLHWTAEEIAHEYNRLVSQHETGSYIISYDSWDKIWVMRSMMRYEDYFPTQEMEFCGEKFPVMNHWEAYLEKTYGDWKRLPPEEERCNHQPYILDLNDGQGDRIPKDGQKLAEKSEKEKEDDLDKKTV